MCFFSLHNEGPPINYPPAQAMKATQGLVNGEAATAAMLRAMADCFQAMASMVETGGATVAAWGEMAAGADVMRNGKAAEVHTKYNAIFTALEQTVERITFSVVKYRELQDYGRSALAEGRGEDFERALVQLGAGGFDAMVLRRIELLRKLKNRVQLLQKMQASGAELLATNNFAEFFLWFMEPIRDVSLAVHSLYDEGIRGAQAAHRAMNQTTRMVGEELSADFLKLAQMAMPMPMAPAGNGVGAAAPRHQSHG